MSILDRYKARILKQLNVSTEDWWDDLRKEYYEDTLDSGPVDVWEEPELPKAIGVKSPVWTELLTRGDDDMFHYRNLGGKSGVSEYDTGPDWFLIKFKDGSMYLYTVKSTDPSHIQNMRQLAEMGSGLNSYVNRLVGNQYAGRNYKGAITLTPGIESHQNKQLVRALQLIIAYQNTLKVTDMSTQIAIEQFKDMETKAGKDGLEPIARQALHITLEYLGVKVSNESLWGAVKYLFGGNYENLPKVNAAYDEAVDSVKNTYGNPDWVKKRRLNTGSVKIKSYSAVAKEGPNKVFERVKANNAKSLEINSKIFKDELEYLSKYASFLSGNDRQDKEKAKSLNEMFITKPNHSFEQADEMDLGSADTVKALSAEDIIATAQVFIEAVSYRRKTDQLYSSGFYKAFHTDTGKQRYGREGTETAKLDGDAKELSLKIGVRIDHMEEAFYGSIMSAWDNIDGVVRGSLMLMEASAD